MKNNNEVWVIQIGEPVAYSNKTSNERLFRSGLLSNKIASEGSNVTWWASNVDHARKKLRFDNYKVVQYKKNLKICFLNGCVYKRNISLSRVINHIQLALNYLLEFKKHKNPDIIIINYPTPELAFVAVLLGKIIKIKTVIDLRDLWPDDLVNLQPRYKYLLKIFLLPMSCMGRWAIKNADYLVSITHGYLRWGLEFSKRNNNPDRQKVFPLAYENINSQKQIKTNIALNSNKLTRNNINIVFAGMLGASVDLSSLLTTINILVNEGLNVKCYICGAGDKYSDYLRNYNKNKHITFLGFVDMAKLNDIFLKAHFGLMPYLNLGSLSKNIPNKVGEYLSYGMPIITTLPGVSSRLIIKEKVGLFLSKNDSSYLKIKLSQYLLNYINNKDKWMETRLRCQRLYLANYNSDKVYTNFIKWVNKL